MPWPVTSLSTLKRLLPVGLALIGIAALLIAIRQTYQAGFDAGKAEAEIMIAAAREQGALDLVAAHRKLLEVEASMQVLEREYAERLAEARAQREIQVRTVERVIRENPDFAAIERPADLQRVRDEQLAAIATAAAAGGATTAAQLPGASLPALPRPGPDDRRQPRRGGSG